LFFVVSGEADEKLDDRATSDASSWRRRGLFGEAAIEHLLDLLGHLLVVRLDVVLLVVFLDDLRLGGGPVRG
jgi:hypothetical protein